MSDKIIQLDIPVPPAPILEQAVGYENTHNARYLSLWWEPAGDEAMVSDGFVTFTGHWPGYLSFIHHRSIYYYLASYNLGSSDDPADYRLVVDLLERKAYIAKSSEVEVVLARQWGQEFNETEPDSLSTNDFEELLHGFVEKMQTVPSMDKVKQRMEEDHQAAEALIRWLDGQTR